MIWSVFAGLIIFIVAVFYAMGVKTGRLKSENIHKDQDLDAHAKAKNIHHRLRYDRSFAKRVRDTFRR